MKWERRRTHSSESKLHSVLRSCEFCAAVYRQIRECLRLDPDHKKCFPHYKVRWLGIIILELFYLGSQFLESEEA